MSDQPTGNLEQELGCALNRYSAEKGSDTPDFILAEYLKGAIAAFDAAVRRRDGWYGIHPRPGMNTPFDPEVSRLRSELEAARERIKAMEAVVEATREFEEVPAWGFILALLPVSVAKEIIHYRVKIQRALVALSPAAVDGAQEGR